MKTDKRGGNLVEYVIPIALVAIVAGLGLYYLSSGSRLSNFAASTANMKVDTASQKGVIGDSKTSAVVNAGDMGGTPEKPVVKCENDKCVIDYGRYILNGVPENFGQFVESSANSGGTDEIANLIMQIANQLELEGNNQGAQDFRNLANLGHFIAHYEKQIEDQGTSCRSQTSPTCFWDKVTYNSDYSTMIPPDSIKNLIPNFISASGLDNLMDITRIGAARKDQKQYPDKYKNLITQNPSYAYIDVLDKIQDNPAYGSELKGIATTLSQYIEKLGAGHSYATNMLFYQGSQETMDELDVITGESIAPAEHGTGSNFYDQLLNPQYSTNTNLDSALICASGQNNDNGSQCTSGT